eukprot:TRINITY_DN4498_c0_g1_i1.p1 TRINITY_DN4498_c0_g1~~TRINITY_DN4498_c0_g1_i1.p1  ORF type:complete len:470 (-),score=66.01 TRINITY_DN4498_c0_g1_i1:620-1942(-)
MGGHGTGVLRPHRLVALLRGLTAGVVSTSCLFLSQATGVPQHWMVAARGVGLICGPLMMAKVIAYLTYRGEAMTGYVLILTVKMICEIVVPRVSAPPVLVVGFYLIGFCQASMDTWLTALVTLVYKDRCGQAMVIYCGIYGVGCMVAPFLTIADPRQAWNLLAGMDFALAVFLAYKRSIVGKPANWKRAMRETAPVTVELEDECSRDESASASEGRSRNIDNARAPRRLLRAANAFIVVSEAAETAMSSWCFTYAVTSFGYDPKIAAMFPTTFYAAFTGMRIGLIPLTTRFTPGLVLQLSTLLTLISGLAFYTMSMFKPDDNAEPPPAWPLLLCLGCFGTGSCALYSMMIAFVRLNGRLTPEDTSLYDMSCNVGITLGLWLPGFCSLPAFECLGVCVNFLLVHVYMADFMRNTAALAQQKAMIRPNVNSAMSSDQKVSTA